MMSKHSDNSVEFCFLSEPTDVNFGGKVHGGMVMKWIDQASCACAANGIRFIRPILVDQMVTVTAPIVHTRRSSMHIYIVIRANDPKENNPVITNRCLITFMATDESGYPIKVPKFEPKNNEESMLEEVVMHAKDFAKQLDQDFEDKLGWK